MNVIVLGKRMSKGSSRAAVAFCSNKVTICGSLGCQLLVEEVSESRPFDILHRRETGTHWR